MRTRWVVVAGLLFVAGCGDGQGYATQPPDPLRGKQFVAEKVVERGKPRALVDGTEVSMSFPDAGGFVVNAGCNSMMGSTATHDGKLNTDGLSMTEMGCDQARQEQDGWLLAVLQSGPEWRVEGEKLRITSPDAEIVFAPKKDFPLTGTRWLLDTVTTGEIAQSSQQAATLVFEQDHVLITTECNSGRAAYRIDGDRMVFDGTALTRKACPDELMQAEQAIVPVLDGEVAFRVHSGTLELDHPSGNGLRLHAQE